MEESIKEKDERIEELSEAIEFAINYLSASDIGQVQMVVKSLQQALRS